MTTKVEVAKLVSVLGFEIDTAQLEKFEALTRTLRSSTVKLARDLRQTNNQLTAVSTKIKAVNGSLNSIGSKRGAATLSQGYANLTRNVNVAQTGLNRLSTTVSVVEPKLQQQALTVGRLARSWAHYAREVRQANTDLRNRPPPSPPRPPRGGGGSGGGGSGGSSRGGGGSSGFLGGAATGFLSNFSPAAGLAGGAVTAGYGAKMIYDAGRDYRAMKQVLLASSRDVNDFNRNLEYTRKTTNELGTDVVEFGKAYSKTLQAVGDKMSRGDTEKMFRQFSELMVVMHSSADDQKGIFRAMSQMFSKGKIQMEEVNQMAERNVPALAMITRAYKELGYTQAEFEKMQMKGQIDPTKFLPLMAKYAQEYARNNGALEKAMQSSTTKIGIFKNRLKEMSDQIMESGFDRLIGEMFTGFLKLAEALAPLVTWLSKATVGMIEFTKSLVGFIKAHPVVAGFLSLLIGRFVLMRVALRMGIPVIGMFFLAIIRGLAGLKVALIRTGILAIFVALGEVFAALYEHMNGENNWLSVMIKYMTIFGLKIENVYLQFMTLMSAIRREFQDSAIYGFFSKLFSFDFGNAFKGAVDPFGDGGPSAAQQAPPTNPAAQNRKMVNQFADYGVTIPKQQQNIMGGGFNAKYTLEIVNGQQQYRINNGQKVNLGGLAK